MEDLTCKSEVCGLEGSSSLYILRRHVKQDLVLSVRDDDGINEELRDFTNDCWQHLLIPLQRWSM